jgi:tryptophan synthase alpha chain
MNRIDRLFKNKAGEILSIYITAGYPDLNDTTTLIESLARHGADMIEIGIPFSDPLADGPIIQQSSQIALGNGMSLELLFDQLKDIRQKVNIPLVMMGYLNPVLKMGMEVFLKKCQTCGIDGVIIPDLPPREYAAVYRDQFQSLGLYHPLLITPHTEEGRIDWIAELSTGFIYLVADSATTGSKSSLGSHQLEYFKRLQNMELPVPSLIGFGISNHETFRTACGFARGTIIGSAFIKAIAKEKSETLDQAVAQFIKGIKGDR